ncbi:hypothetical protein [Zavarzinia sp. CC-PAN008]|uniref:hypothetical protein n=1 Tax=Zavarzinia sp. CC-PAN008 TaxID=3243332 RepID=UPI003F742E6D
MVQGQADGAGVITATVARDGVLAFHQPVTAAARALMALGGLVPLLAPYELLVRPQWLGFSIATVFVLVICAGAVVVSALFLSTAILGVARTFVFDPRTRILTADDRGLFGRRKRHYGFDDLGAIAMVADETTDSGTRYRLSIGLRGQMRRLEIDWFDDIDSAEEARAMLRDTLGGPHARGPVLGWVRPLETGGEGLPRA